MKNCHYSISVNHRLWSVGFANLCLPRHRNISYKQKPIPATAFRQGEESSKYRGCSPAPFGRAAMLCSNKPKERAGSAGCGGRWVFVGTSSLFLWGGAVGLGPGAPPSHPSVGRVQKQPLRYVSISTNKRAAVLAESVACSGVLQRS